MTESVKGDLEIVYDVQWKTPANDDDKSKIVCIVDTPDTIHDWNVFKAYLIQNSGYLFLTHDDIRISYLDSDDDLIPVDSEMDFRECLKFSRSRARRSTNTVIKVSMISNGAKPKGAKQIKHNEEVNKFRMPLRRVPPVKRSSGLSGKETIPEWFDVYMTKFKTDLVQEITSAVISNVTASVGRPNNSGIPSNNRSHSQHAEACSNKSHLHHVFEKRKKKKKMPEEDSSDCTDGLQLQWEERLELLRHMQKMNKREKKFEKKLDMKLEKLENKTKKIIEKKQHTLWGYKKLSKAIPPVVSTSEDASSYNNTASAVATAPTEFIMDATPLEEYNFVPHVVRGELVSQVWQVINNGQMPWTNETELRFAWGSKSLVPLTTVVKCPPLQPGETGKVKVTLQAPYFPGNFESYWHFLHQGRRFGHWLGCAVIVEADVRSSPSHTLGVKPQDGLDVFPNDQGPLPVDLTMKCTQSNNTQSCSDDMKIYNIESQPENGFVKTQEATEASVKDAASAVAHDADLNFVLEDFPRLESYTTVPDPKLLSLPESFPDVVEGIQLSYDTSMTLSRMFLEESSDEHEELVKKVQNSDDSCPYELPRMLQPRLEESSDKHEELVKKVQNSDDACPYELPRVLQPRLEESSDKHEELVKKVQNRECSCHYELPRMQQLHEEMVKKMQNISLSCEPQEIDYDYFSDSDADNISIISGTVSFDTDPEPTDEFVIVPAAEEISDTAIAPTTVSSENDQEEEEAQHNSDNNNNTQLQLQESVAETAEEVKEDAAKKELLPDEENTVYVRDSSSGISVPVAKVVTTPLKTDAVVPQQAPVQGHYSYGEPFFSHGPNGPRFPLILMDPQNSPLHCNNPGGACNYRPLYESPAATNPYYNTQRPTGGDSFFGPTYTLLESSVPTHQQSIFVPQDPRHPLDLSYSQMSQQTNFSSQSTAAGGQMDPLMYPHPLQHQNHPQHFVQRSPPRTEDSFSDMVNPGCASVHPRGSSFCVIHTEQPRSSNYKINAPSNASSRSTSSGNGPIHSTPIASSRRTSSESREMSPVAAAVQILPETLVSGAVNVASSAINTARSVIDMLRPRHEEPMVPQWELTPAMERSLKHLEEMGFKNRELNIMLLQQYNNDLARIVAELV